MSCDVMMLCYVVTLCYVMLGYVMILCYVMICYVEMLCYVMLCYDGYMDEDDVLGKETILVGPQHGGMVSIAGVHIGFISHF